MPACGASDDGDGTGGALPPADEATSLAFVPGGVLRLRLLERNELNVVVGPPGHHRIRFALLPDRPNAAPNDAALDRAETVSDSRGVAGAFLTAPSTASTFTVRAAVGELEALLPVSVSDRGYGAVSVVPNYGGTREVEEWVASVRIGSSCADLAGFPPPDGALVATSKFGESPSIDSVPVGAVAAVSVRAGQYAYGCTTVPDLNTGEVRDVPVEVVDRPMQLAGTVELSLHFDQESDEWTTLLSSAVDSSLAALRGGAPDDVVMLLDDMEQLATQPEDFAQNRSEYDFDGLLRETVLPANHLHQRAALWLATGIAHLAPLVGQLELRPSSALFELVSAAGAPAPQSGFLGSATWSAFASPGDTLVLGGALRFQPVQWVVALADGPALQEYTGAQDAAEALALHAQCRLIARTLIPASGPLYLYGTCDEECSVHLCEAALVTAWARAGDAGGDLVRLSMALTGTAAVDDEARPVSLEGSWLGTLAGPSSAVGGQAKVRPPP